MYRAASLLAGRGPDLWRLWGCLTQASMWWASQIRPCSCPYFGTPCSPSHCSRARLPCWVVQTSTPIASASGASEAFLTSHGCFNLLDSSRLGSLEQSGPSNKYNIKGEDLMPRQSTFSYPISNQPRYITNSNGIKLQLKKARLEFHHDSQGTKTTTTKKNKKTRKQQNAKPQPIIMIWETKVICSRQPPPFSIEEFYEENPLAITQDTEFKKKIQKHNRRIQWI